MHSLISLDEAVDAFDHIFIKANEHSQDTPRKCAIVARVEGNVSFLYTCDPITQDTFVPCKERLSKFK